MTPFTFEHHPGDRAYMVDPDGFARVRQVEVTAVVYRRSGVWYEIDAGETLVRGDCLHRNPSDAFFALNAA